MTQSKQPAPAGPPLMTVTYPGSGADKTVVWLRGEHDLSSADMLSDVIATAAAAYETDVSVDLGGVEFMDSTTLHAILRARSSIETSGRTVTVRNPSRNARFMLGVCGLEQLLTARSAKPARPVEVRDLEVSDIERSTGPPPPRAGQS